MIELTFTTVTHTVELTFTFKFPLLIQLDHCIVELTFTNGT